jgi:hypothetical protein
MLSASGSPHFFSEACAAAFCDRRRLLLPPEAPVKGANSVEGASRRKRKSYALGCTRITGGTVMDRIIAIDHFSEKDAAAVTADVLNAVHYLHNIGITHRDLKVRGPPLFIRVPFHLASLSVNVSDAECGVGDSRRICCMLPTTRTLPITTQLRWPTSGSPSSCPNLP